METSSVAALPFVVRPAHSPRWPPAPIACAGGPAANTIAENRSVTETAPITVNSATQAFLVRAGLMSWLISAGAMITRTSNCVLAGESPIGCSSW